MNKTRFDSRGHQCLTTDDHAVSRSLLILTSSANIGRKIVAVATLLVTSVNAAVNVLSTRTSNHGGKLRKLMKNCPMMFDNLDT